MVYNLGHSTPEMAGKFAKDAEVGSLVLNHFSRSIRPSDSRKIRDKASKASGLSKKKVLCAKDNLLLHVCVKQKGPRASGIGTYYDVRDANLHSQNNNVPRMSWAGDKSKEPKNRKLQVDKLKALRQEITKKMRESRLSQD